MTVCASRSHRPAALSSQRAAACAARRPGPTRRPPGRRPRASALPWRRAAALNVDHLGVSSTSRRSQTPRQRVCLERADGPPRPAGCRSCRTPSCCRDHTNRVRRPDTSRSADLLVASWSITTPCGSGSRTAGSFQPQQRADSNAHPEQRPGCPRSPPARGSASKCSRIVITSRAIGRSLAGS